MGAEKICVNLREINQRKSARKKDQKISSRRCSQIEIHRWTQRISVISRKDQRKSARKKDQKISSRRCSQMEKRRWTQKKNLCKSARENSEKRFHANVRRWKNADGHRK